MCTSAELYWLEDLRFILHYEHKLQVNKTKKTSSYWQKYWEAVTLHLSDNVISVIQVMQKHYLGEVEK